MTVPALLTFDDERYIISVYTIGFGHTLTRDRDLNKFYRDDCVSTIGWYVEGASLRVDGENLHYVDNNGYIHGDLVEITHAEYTGILESIRADALSILNSLPELA